MRENTSEGFRKAVHLEILKIEFETITKYEWLKTQLQEEKEKSLNINKIRPDRFIG